MSAHSWRPAHLPAVPAVHRLQVDALDCYLVHSPVATFNSIRTLASSLAAVVESGLTKTVGVSNYSGARTRSGGGGRGGRGACLRGPSWAFKLGPDCPPPSRPAAPAVRPPSLAYHLTGPTRPPTCPPAGCLQRRSCARRTVCLPRGASRWRSTRRAGGRCAADAVVVGRREGFPPSAELQNTWMAECGRVCAEPELALRTWTPTRPPPPTCAGRVLPLPCAAGAQRAAGRVPGAGRGVSRGRWGRQRRAVSQARWLTRACWPVLGRT